MFRDLFIKEGYLYDYEYDWCVKPKVEPSVSRLIFGGELDAVIPVEQPQDPPPVPLMSAGNRNPSAPVLPVVQHNTPKRPAAKYPTGAGSKLERPLPVKPAANLPRKIPNWLNAPGVKPASRRQQMPKLRV